MEKRGVDAIRVARWPPKELVVSGRYRLVCNPLYLGVVIFQLGYVFWYPTQTILLMKGLVSASSHLFVVLYDKAHLHDIFGRAYQESCDRVPRGLPHCLGKKQAR